MVTHSNTSRPVQCLCMAERTGCPVLTDLWPYVLDEFCNVYISAQKHVEPSRVGRPVPHHHITLTLVKRPCLSTLLVLCDCDPRLRHDL